MKYLFAIFALASFSMFTQASAFEIGVVDLNQALNQSEPGIRSKNILERRGRQKQQEFKLEESELRKLAEDLRNNPLLTPKAKANKEQELIARQQQLREKVNEAGRTTLNGSYFQRTQNCDPQYFHQRET